MTTNNFSSWSPYKELGVSPSATFEQIKSAFRELARRHHPDKGGLTGSEDAGEKFKRIRQAYEILCDNELRAKFDSAGITTKSSSGGTTAEVDLDDMHFDEAQNLFHYPCRYEITESELDEGYDTVCCNSCSLHITVLYEVEQS